MSVMLSDALAFKRSRSGSCRCWVCFLPPKAPWVKFTEDMRRWLYLDLLGVISLLISALVINAPPGKNFEELTPIKSALDSYMLPILFLYEIKFFFEVGCRFLFKVGSILSPLNKANILSYLPDKDRLEVMWDFLSFGRSTDSFLVLAEAARVFAA